ncbi:MAG: epoxyqueuosine reductase [Lachnospirales bacterium]
MKKYKELNNYIEKNNLDYAITQNKKLDIEINVPIAFSNCMSKNMHLDPKLHMESCNSIIVVAMEYMINKYNKECPHISSGYSHYDYHNILELHLEKISKILQLEKYLIQVDTGPLLEKNFAELAGLGYIGKNNLLITEKFGSKVFLGLILTNDILQATQRKCINKCKTCNKCLKECPTSAISVNKFDHKKCISYLTQTKSDITYTNMKDMKNFLYGCDICIRTCPLNKSIEIENTIDINFLINMNKKDFEIFKNTGIYWRSLNTIKRNAIINYYNIASIIADIETKSEIINKTKEVLKNGTMEE